MLGILMMVFVTLQLLFYIIMWLCSYISTVQYSLCLNLFHLLAQKPKLENVLLIQTNSFIIFTCPNLVFLNCNFNISERMSEEYFMKNPVNTVARIPNPRFTKSL
jgi:hypothetical protein